MNDTFDIASVRDYLVGLQQRITRGLNAIDAIQRIGTKATAIAATSIRYRRTSKASARVMVIPSLVRLADAVFRAGQGNGPSLE